ncbi:hypothetical protein [Halomontanus rarus]|uniref:hypothetical protein n=1 Tax=Halomontanus rarus TaxID=3034020 RepID=UPI001A98C111
MQVEVSITADETELSAVTNLIAQLEEEAELDVSTQSERSNDLDLTEEERYIIAALHEQPRSALRVVHRVATNLDGSPFDSFDEDNGWNEERQNVRDLLWSMKNDGLVDNDGQLWFPTDQAPSHVLN